MVVAFNIYYGSHYPLFLSLNCVYKGNNFLSNWQTPLAYLLMCPMPTDPLYLYAWHDGISFYHINIFTENYLIKHFKRPSLNKSNKFGFAA